MQEHMQKQDPYSKFRASLREPFREFEKKKNAAKSSKTFTLTDDMIQEELRKNFSSLFDID